VDGSRADRLTSFAAPGKMGCPDAYVGSASSPHQPTGKQRRRTVRSVIVAIAPWSSAEAINGQTRFRSTASVAPFKPSILTRIVEGPVAPLTASWA
jgi:hypothetical protein